MNNLFTLNKCAYSNTMNDSRIGFIGLGKIGLGMAQNISSKYKLLVYDIDDKQYNELKGNKDNINIASSISEIASNTKILISVLPNDKILCDIVENELYKNQSSESIHISCSTVSNDTSLYLSDLHYKYNKTSYISSPVFARPDGMFRGESTIIISGGNKQLRDNIIKPILSTTSTSIYDFGDDVGAANIVKICGNFLIASAIEGLSESMALAQKNNVDRNELYRMLSETIFDCLIYKGYGQRVSQFDHKPYENAHFALELGYKDVNLMKSIADKSKVPMPFLSILHERYTKSINKDRNKLDWSAIALNVNEDAGYDITQNLENCKKL